MGKRSRSRMAAAPAIGLAILSRACVDLGGLSGAKDAADAGPSTDGAPTPGDGEVKLDSASEGGVTLDGASVDGPFNNCAMSTFRQGALSQSLSFNFGAPWTDSAKALSFNGQFATSTVMGGALVTDLLVVRTFGHKLPATAVVNGVTVKIFREATGGLAFDDVIAIATDALGQSASKARALAWPSSEGATEYGGPTDTWGLALTPELVNDPSFRAVLTAKGAAAEATTVRVDEITTNIHYCY